MNSLHALILGLVQGLTEFLPISSTAHLRVVPHFLGWDDPGAAFSATIQLGTLFAVFAYFAADIKELVLAALQGLRHRDLNHSPSCRLAWAIVPGTLPIGILGLTFKDFIETEARGLCQALALVPGCSRSGSTIMGGLFIGLKREAAARFSFLLGLPAIGASGLLEFLDLLEEGLAGTGLINLGLGILAAAVSGYLSIGFLLRFLQRHGTNSFSVYRILLGGVILYSIYG